MKKKLSILTVAFVVIAITMAGHRAFGDGYHLLRNDSSLMPDSLSFAVNSLFGTTYENNAALSSLRPANDTGGKLTLDYGSVFLLFTDGIELINVNNVTSGLSQSLSLARSDQSYDLNNLLAKQGRLTGTGGLTGRDLIGTFTFRAKHRFTDLGYTSNDSNGGIPLGPVLGYDPPYSAFPTDHYVYFDVTALLHNYLDALGNYGTEGGFDIYSGNAYLVGFSGMDYGSSQFPYGFNDAMFLVLTAPVIEWRDPGAPEPATVILWTLGGLSLACTSRVRNRRMKKLAL